MTRTSTGDRLGLADAADLPLLERAVELHLRGERQLAHLVEEERPALRLLEEAGLRAAAAPVNAPRAWPNSSLSTSSAGSAPQFTATKRRSRRAEW